MWKQQLTTQTEQITALGRNSTELNSLQLRECELLNSCQSKVPHKCKLSPMIAVRGKNNYFKHLKCCPTLMKVEKYYFEQVLE